jgi:peptide/nickel transport system substrate-binding protein
MKQNRFYVVLSVLILVSMLLASCKPATTTPAAVKTTEAPVVATTEAPKASWFDQVVFTMVADAEPAVAQIQAGTIDLYSATIDKAEVYKTVLADPNLKVSATYGSSNQMLLNTVDCTPKGLLNPFNDMQIREAMNWAMDRNYVVQEIFGGLAKAKFNPFTTAFPDYARYADLFSAVETKYAYNLDKAKAVVDERMPALGATKGADGKWQYNGKPVVVIVLIRTEDLRKEIGNYFSNQLEALGFTVDRQEKTRSEAAPIWQGDPTECTFNAYTAGWISPQIYRDEGLNFLQYDTGQLQQIPVMNAYDPSADLLDASTKLYTNDFTNMDERKELFKKALDLSMTESWWGVWVNDTIAFEVSAAKVYGASDLAGGFAGAQLFPYTAGITGQEGGVLRIANSGILVDAWNPVSGSNWIDDTIVRNFTVDYGLIYNPYTGLVMPKLVQSAQLDAVNGLPIAAPQSDWVKLNFTDTIAVPDDAWVDWDAVNQKWITAAEKKAADPTWEATAKTKSTVVYSPDVWKETWHDGSAFTIADVVFGMIMSFDPGKADSAIYDESIGASLDTYLTHFKGVKIVSTDPLTIETYDDTFALDTENNIKDWFPNIYGISGYAGGMIAWHNLTPAIQAQADGKMAFSKDMAETKQVDYTSQISGPTLEVQMAYVDQDITNSYIPYAATMGAYITADEAVARYNNLKAFYAAHGHIFLGTGPYMVDKVYPVEGSISLVKYDAYPFPAGQFAQFAEPMIMTMSVDGPTSVAAGTEAAFDVMITFNDEPYPAKDIDAVSYTLFNVDGSIVATGTAEFVADGQYKVTLTADQTAALEAGTVKLTVAAASNQVSLPAFETVEFVVTK